jgi:hypothetical protein
MHPEKIYYIISNNYLLPIIIMERCLNCNNLNKTQSKYCTSCGANLENQSQECPECGSQNKPGTSFCASCGNDLQSGSITSTKKTETPEKAANTKKRSSVLKIFLIIIFSIVGIGIVVLVGLYFFSDFLAPEESEELIVSDNIELPKEEMSDKQKRLLGMFGDPDEFIILFDEGDNNSRLESWIYEGMKGYFSFKDGAYIGGDRVVTEPLKEDGYKLRPEDFVYGLNKDEVRAIVGEHGQESMDEATGYTLLNFGTGNLVCTFNEEGLLINVVRSRNIIKK